ncbi:uncharacterized protein PS065_012785 [Dugong dugon]
MGTTLTPTPRTPACWHSVGSPSTQGHVRPSLVLDLKLEGVSIVTDGSTGMQLRHCRQISARAAHPGGPSSRIRGLASSHPARGNPVAWMAQAKPVATTLGTTVPTWLAPANSSWKVPASLLQKCQHTPSDRRVVPSGSGALGLSSGHAERMRAEKELNRRAKNFPPKKEKVPDGVEAHLSLSQSLLSQKSQRTTASNLVLSHYCSAALPLLSRDAWAHPRLPQSVEFLPHLEQEITLSLNEARGGAEGSPHIWGHRPGSGGAPFFSVRESLQSRLQTPPPCLGTVGRRLNGTFGRFRQPARRPAPGALCPVPGVSGTRSCPLSAGPAGGGRRRRTSCSPQCTARPAPPPKSLPNSDGPQKPDCAWKIYPFPETFRTPPARSRRRNLRRSLWKAVRCRAARGIGGGARRCAGRTRGVVPGQGLWGADYRKGAEGGRDLRGGACGGMLVVVGGASGAPPHGPRPARLPAGTARGGNPRPRSRKERTRGATHRAPPRGPVAAGLPSAGGRGDLLTRSAAPRTAGRGARSAPGFVRGKPGLRGRPEPWPSSQQRRRRTRRWRQT